jgi:oxysterol-binding protein-related protein 9/10/11
MSSISENKSGLKQFLASISSIRGDLSHITAPPFLLAQKSATEFPATWCERPSILVAPASEPDPEKRALLVLKWYLSALKAQQYHTGREADGVKKPLNAFLGELFIAEWDEEDTGKTKLISEQVRY